MPFGERREREGIGLALSGGGYRAMLFHLGSLWRLNELGILNRLARISSVSGGSLTSGRLAVRWNALTFEEGVATNFREEVALPVIQFSEALVDVLAIALGLVPGVSAARIAAAFYGRYLVDHASLQDLPEEPEAPRFVFNSTHLASATSWRFSKPYMGCYRLGLVRNPDVPLAQAIAASAAFPPFLSPLTLHLDPSKFDNVEGADLHDRTELKRTVALSDGGVYDNLGLETVSPFHTILSSDAGGALSIKPGRFWSWPSQVSRVIDTATEQARALRRRRLADELLSGKKEGAFWRTSSHLDKYPVAPAFPVHPSWRGYLASLPTRLAPFSDDRDRYRLVNWGYLVADVALRSYVTTDAPPPLALPFLQAEFSEPAPASQAAVAGDDRPTTASEVNE